MNEVEAGRDPAADGGRIGGSRTPTSALQDCKPLWICLEEE